MKPSIPACLLAAFSSLASGYSIDICSNACSSRACCTTLTGPNDRVWRDLPAGYRGRLRHMKLNSGCCEWDETLAIGCPPASWGSPTSPGGRPATGAYASTRFNCW